jgi:ADP-L-glycero-D-manno-heptose 6-epimerase
MLWLWENGPSGLYNSGTGKPRTWLDLVHAVFAALGRQPEIEFIEMPGNLGAQYQNYTCARMDKLRTAGFARPATSLEEGVAQTLQAVSAII